MKRLAAVKELGERHILLDGDSVHLVAVKEQGREGGREAGRETGSEGRRERGSEGE